MKILFLISLLGIYEAFARNEIGEPERKPVAKLVCLEPEVQFNNTPSYSYYSATLYESLFFNDFVKVTKNECVKLSNNLTCRGEEIGGLWEIFITRNQYFLLDTRTNKRIPLDCRKVN